MILVVCALRPELRYAPPRTGVVVIESGVGPVEAALTTARALATSSYDAVINAGIGGAFRGRARVGDALIVEAEWFADLGLEGGERLTLPGDARLVDYARADGALLASVRDAGPAIESGITVTQVTQTAATAQRLENRYAAAVESMEGFAILRAASEAGIPALEVRGISNYVGTRAESEWDFAAGARAAARGLDAVLRALDT